MNPFSLDPAPLARWLRTRPAGSKAEYCVAKFHFQIGNKCHWSHALRGWPIGTTNPGRSVDMPTVASHVISKQALSTPSSFSLYSILCPRFRMHWLSPD
jgi:hypothetical protein